MKWTPDYNALRVDGGQQPYIKLHGSSDWLRSGPEPTLLVLGGSKSVEIAQDPLLSWYHKLFRDALIRSGARLMIIGYGFADRHINEVIAQAANGRNLTIFVVDPASGVDLVCKPQEPPVPLWEKLPACIRGGSRRPLSRSGRIAWSTTSSWHSWPTKSPRDYWKGAEAGASAMLVAFHP
jgi:hypothetical protein